jgi:hypothetical protein
MVVCAVRYEPVSLSFAASFLKKTAFRSAKNIKRCCSTGISKTSRRSNISEKQGAQFSNQQGAQKPVIADDPILLLARDLELLECPVSTGNQSRGGECLPEKVNVESHMMERRRVKPQTSFGRKAAARQPTRRPA